MVRKQYPLRPAYATTFNGSQGTALKRCTIDVRKNPFAYGHLYVALSRVCTRNAVRVLSTPERTSKDSKALARNVVWKELLFDHRSAVVTGKRAFKKPAAASTNLSSKQPRR